VHNRGVTKTASVPFRITQLSVVSSAILGIGLLSLAAIVLRGMGRIWYCACGYIKFWQGENWSPENSQHITDWYTFSHLIHGFIFYWILQKVLPKWSVGSRFVLAVCIEVAWEILENSPLIINRYRATTVSLDYFGDSIINASADIVACMIGFFLARKLPVWLSICLVIAMELVAAYAIRDNLFLNVLMLIYPLQAVKVWQMQ